MLSQTLLPLQQSQWLLQVKLGGLESRVLPNNDCNETYWPSRSIASVFFVCTVHFILLLRGWSITYYSLWIGTILKGIGEIVSLSFSLHLYCIHPFDEGRAPDWKPEIWDFCWILTYIHNRHSPWTGSPPSSTSRERRESPGRRPERDVLYHGWYAKCIVRQLDS